MGLHLVARWVELVVFVVGGLVVLCTVAEVSDLAGARVTWGLWCALGGLVVMLAGQLGAGATLLVTCNSDNGEGQ